MALAGIDAVVDNLAALDDGRSRERALAQLAYLYPVVRQQEEKATHSSVCRSRTEKAAFAVEPLPAIPADPLTGS